MAVPLEAFVAILYLAYFAPLGVAVGLLVDPDFRVPADLAGTDEAVFRQQAAATIVVVVTALHAILGAVLMLRGSTGWERYNSLKNVAADLLILAGLAGAVVSLSMPPTGAAGSACTEFGGSLQYCGGAGVWVAVASVAAATIGNVFCFAGTLEAVETADKEQEAFLLG